VSAKTPDHSGTRQGFTYDKQWWADAGTAWSGIIPLVGDVTGDKVADFTILGNSGTGVRAYVGTSDKHTFGVPQLWWDGTGWDFTRIKANMGDIDGNKASDIVLTYREPDGSTSTHVGKSTLTGFWIQLWWWDQYTSWDNMTPFVGNVNADGNDDYGFITPSPTGTRAYVLRSTNNVLLAPEVWWDGAGWGYSGIKVARR
jgi:hypothetical protein